MSVVQSLYGNGKWANWEAGLGGFAPVHEINFFTNDFTPITTSLLTDFTLLTLSQWVQTPLSSCGFNTIHGATDGSAYFNDGIILAIIDPYSGSMKTVYGWLLIDTANNQVVQSERYATPLDIPLTGAVIYAPVGLHVGHYAP